MPVRLLIQRFRMNRAAAIIVSVIGFFVIIGLLGMPILRTVVDQINPLRLAVEGGVEQISESLSLESLEQNSILAPFIPFIEPLLGNSETAQPSGDLIGQAITQITDAVGRLGGSVLPFVGGLASSLLSVLIIFFLGMYLLAEPELYVNGILKLTPIWYRERMQDILRRLDSTLRGWLSVTAVSMVAVTILTGLGLRLVGIQQEAFALGLLAGLLSFVPNFGPVVALVPSVAVAITKAPDNVIWVVIIIYGVSFFQSQVISPVLASERMNMPAILILLGQIIFGFFFGFLGLMLAVPLSACFAVLVDEMYVKDILGDSAESESVAPAEAPAPLESVGEELAPSPG